MRKEENNTYFTIFLPIFCAIALCVIILLLNGFHIINTISIGKSDDLFVGLCTLFTGILAITGVCFTIFNSQRLKNKELLNDLDQKSEWRKELMNIAAKPVMQLEDVYRILASLRFLPKDEDEIKGEESKQPKEQNVEKNKEQSNNKEEQVKKDEANREDGSNQKEFDVISNFIYKELNMILNKFLLGSITKKTYTKEFLDIPLSIKNSEEIRLYTKFLLKHHWEYNQGEKDKKKFKKKELKEFKKVMKEIHRLNQEDNIKEDYYKTDKIYIGILDDYAKEIEKNSKDK